jgi:hypothetical protein
MTTATPNAKPLLKKLSDQLDRLNSVLDRLGDALNQAVANAAREGTRLAVKDSIVDIMTDPTLRTKAHQATTQETPVKPVFANETGFWKRMTIYAGQAVESVRYMASAAMSKVKDKVGMLRQTVAETIQSIRDLETLKTTALLVVLIGTVVSLMAPHAVSAALTGISSAIAVVAVRLGMWPARTRREVSLA